MSGKRRCDHKGRVLKEGESQRKDLRYQYRYTDLRGKRQTVYAVDLRTLREKEAEILQKQHLGIDYAAGKTTVRELVDRHIAVNQGVTYNTKVGYQFVSNVLKKETFGHREIRSVRVSDAKAWLLKLYEDGYKYNSIASVRGVVKPAFQMAVNDDILMRNPFDFRLDIIPNETEPRQALTLEEQNIFMKFIQEDPHYRIYYDEFNILLWTGVRVSELTGLTKEDVDFEKRRIHVHHQLQRKRDGVYYMKSPKTKSGDRFIPMTDGVYESLRNVIRNRKTPAEERTVDGFSGFLFLDKNGEPEVAMHVAHHMQWARNKYARTHERQLPLITPHVFRHTFCTNLLNAGVDVKSVQYLMGHSGADITLNTYAHASFETAEKSMMKGLLVWAQDADADEAGLHQFYTNLV